MHKVILHVDFIDKQLNCHAGFARLEVELPFTPTADIAIEHPVWHNPRTPVAVSFNLENGEFFVGLGNDSLRSKEEVAQHVEMYKSHEWQVTL